MAKEKKNFKKERKNKTKQVLLHEEPATGSEMSIVIILQLQLGQFYSQHGSCLDDSVATFTASHKFADSVGDPAIVVQLQ